MEYKTFSLLGLDARQIKASEDMVGLVVRVYKAGHRLFMMYENNRFVILEATGDEYSSHELTIVRDLPGLWELREYGLITDKQYQDEYQAQERERRKEEAKRRREYFLKLKQEFEPEQV